MAETNPIATQIAAVLVAAKWPQGRTAAQAQSDIDAVTRLMSARIPTPSSGIKPNSDPGPHGLD